MIFAPNILQIKVVKPMETDESVSYTHLTLPTIA